MREKLNKGLVSISYPQLEMKRIKHNIPHISRKREKGTNSESLKWLSSKRVSFLCIW